MLLPLILIVGAIASATLVAYGVHPDLAQYSHGLMIIMLARRLMWPAIVVSMGLCLALLGLVISGKRRAWWLIGLGPVLALFVHRFGPGMPGPAAVVETPTFVEASSRAAPEAGDYVLGLTFEGRAYAFPFRALFVTPIVCVTDYDHRMLLIWNAYANRATAVMIARELKPRDLEAVSSPANSLLVYDGRLGQFISGVTGKRVDGRDAIGFGPRVQTRKLPWSNWKGEHPDTLVMIPFGRTADIAAAPSRPILPQFKVRLPTTQPDATTPVLMLATTQPTAVSEDVALRFPMNATSGQTSVLLVRDKAGATRAYDRHLGQDLFLTFRPKTSRKLPDVALEDSDTGSFWTLDGRAIDGSLKGQKLREIEVDDGLYWGVMKHWYPALELARSATQ
jgi:Protein of unknown function (DUF3179)